MQFILMKKKILRWTKIFVLFYCIVGIALYYLQDYFLFHPTVLPRNYQYHFNVPFSEVEIPFNKTDTLNMVKFTPVDSVRKGVVIYFHGNRENINRFAKFSTNFTKLGYEVWMADYPGYGKSVGNRTEKILYQQSIQLYKMASSKYAKDSIVIYGKSFGTGIAAYLAAEYDCKQLILETPYYSIPDLLGAYTLIYPIQRMSKYKIPTYQYLEDIKVPITIFHGTDDWVIPYSCAEKLKEVLKTTDQFVTIEKGSHNDLNDFPLYHQKLDSLLKL
jgi:alpha-beta hydrolase superfamily lysophospholipase